MIKNRTVYLCKTQELAEEFLKDCEKEGLVWCTGHKPLEFTLWKRRYDGDYAVFYIRNKRLTFGSGKDWEERHYCEEEYKDWEVVEPKSTETELPDFMQCVCIEADSYEEAVKKFKEKYGNIEQYIVQVDENTTTVLAPTGDIGVAKCHPDDRFDIVEGFSVALDKINTKILNRNLDENAIKIMRMMKSIDCEEFYIDSQTFDVVGIDDESDTLITFDSYVVGDSFANFEVDHVYCIKDFNVGQ